jgi:tetratricopeptide (TPR) repeat protein
MSIPRGGALFSLILALVASAACKGGADGKDPESVPGGETDLAATSSQMELPEGAQAISFLGEPLYPPSLPEETRIRREEQLAEALAELEADPDGADALIWVGRRYAYLGSYREAIETFTRGIETHPEDPRFYRHRGHRWITVREPDRAIADFRIAADLIQGTEDEVEPDGQPNARGIPTSTLHFNILYHYGLAHFIKGDFEDAEAVYRRCMDASVHADSKVATAHWLYMTLRRLGREDEARSLAQGWDLEGWADEIIESGSYLELLELYAGPRSSSGQPLLELDPGTLEGATLGYGIGNFHYYNGRIQEAREIFRGIVGARDQWAAFGYIAAEAELARMQAP